MRLVSDNDEDAYNSNAFYLSENVQTVSNTPFAAMLAKQQTNYASAEAKPDKRSAANYGIGVPGRDSVKEVSSPYIVANFNGCVKCILAWNGRNKGINERGASLVFDVSCEDERFQRN